VELKYRAPPTKAFPSLSTDGSLVLDPRYLSSKLSYAVNVASLAASADACALAALDALELAADAELDALVADVLALLALVDALLAELAALVADVDALLALLDALVAEVDALLA
jgi:hypothetical protein